MARVKRNPMEFEFLELLEFLSMEFISADLLFSHIFSVSLITEKYEEKMHYIQLLAM